MIVNKPSSRLDKRQIRRSFNQAAGTYDEVAVLQRTVAANMMERLDVIKLQPETIIDIGCGTAIHSVTLQQRYPAARVYALDLSLSMLDYAKRQEMAAAATTSPLYYVNADAERLPIASNSMDMIFSNLTLQWCPDLMSAFSEFQRILKPGGLLMFTSFGIDTLKELRKSWLAVNTAPHVNEFVDMHDIGDLLMSVGLAEPVMDMEYYTLTYSSVKALMRDLKELGAHNVMQGRTRGLTGKAKLQRMIDAYERYRVEGLIPATYEIIYGHAWGVERNDRGGPQDELDVVFEPRWRR